MVDLLRVNAPWRSSRKWVCVDFPLRVPAFTMLSLDSDIVARVFAEANRLRLGMQVCKRFRKEFPTALLEVPVRLAVKDFGSFSCRLRQTQGLVLPRFHAANTKRMSLACHLQIEDFHILSLSLAGLEMLERLKLERNGLGREGMLILSLSLPTLVHLRELELSCNDLGPEGARLLAQALPTLRGLERLVLKKNAIGFRGASFLGQGLSYLTQLSHLDLHGNNLSSNGMRALVPSLRSLTTLRSLCLGHNNLRLEGTRNLARVLVMLTQVKRLDMRSNFLGGLFPLNPNPNP